MSMKKKILKTFFTLTLVGSLAFSGIGSGWNGMETVQAAKVVAPTTLAQVTGVAYDANTKKVTWNKVTGATDYKITVKYANGEYDGWSTEMKYFSMDDYSEGSYTVTITPRDIDSYYVVAEGSDYDYSEYDQANNKMIYYKYVTGAATTITIQISDEKVVTNAITKLPGITKKEVNEDGVVFKVNGNVTLNKGERICWEYSNNASFKNNKSQGYYASHKFANGYPYGNVTYDAKDTFTVDFDKFASGETIYVRAKVYNGNYQLPNQLYTEYKNRYGAYTTTVTCSVPKVKISNVATSVDGTSITLTTNLKSGSATGYQFAKKVKSKWVTLATQTSPTYTDKSVAKNQKYAYRVRAYSYNKYTQKTVWSDWCNAEATTWGSSLKLKADAAGATSVKLSWKPVSGAEGYEIYRYDTTSFYQIIEKGEGNYFSSAALIKTLKKSGKTYTDKKLTKGKSYTYVVRAYRTINKKKYYIEDEATVALKAKDLDVTSKYNTASGKTVVTWKKMTGIKGYYVEKYDEATEQYVTVKKLSSKKTSYTFANVNVGSDSVSYRIRPYDSQTVYDGYSITVEPTLAAVQGVKAVRSGNGIKVSWKPVAGADYYQVFRTTDSDTRYNKTTKTYSGFDMEPVYEAVINTNGCRPELDGEGYKYIGSYRTEKIKGTSVLDATISYQTTVADDNGDAIPVGKDATGQTLYQTEEAIYNQGPETGVTYYYYVRAYAEAPNGALNYNTISSIGFGKPASATYTNAIAKKVSKITSTTSKKKGQVTVKFKKVSNVDGYAIYRSTKKNGTYSMVGTTSKTSFTDLSAESGKTYYYKVASYVKGEAKANIYSAKTSAKKVKVK